MGHSATMSYTQTTGARVACSVVILSSVAMFGAAFDPDGASATMIYRLGLAATILACTGWVLSQVQANGALIDMVRQASYTAGYTDGCDTARVSRMRLVSSDGVLSDDAFTGLCPSQEFADEDRVGDGFDGRSLRRLGVEQDLA